MNSGEGAGVDDPRRLAAIDIGTVTTRLLIADVSAGNIVEVERSTDITHLGAGLTLSGRLTDAAMARVAACVARYAERIDALGVEAAAAVATSASRDAENAEAFRARLAGFGVEPLVIDGAREAELAFLGATERFSGEGMLVVDCGGGSTELVLGDAFVLDGAREVRVDTMRSVDVGSRRMTELFFATDPPASSELEAARAWAAGEFRAYFEQLDRRPSVMLALAGTATTLAAVKQQLAAYDAELVHGFALSGADLSDLLEMLAALPLTRRREVVGLHPDRAGVIVAGALILETVLALAGLDGLIVSEHDILYGILRDTYRDLQESGSGGAAYPNWHRRRT